MKKKFLNSIFTNVSSSPDSFSIIFPQKVNLGPNGLSFIENVDRKSWQGQMGVLSGHVGNPSAATVTSIICNLWACSVCPPSILPSRDQTDPTSRPTLYNKISQYSLFVCMHFLAAPWARVPFFLALCWDSLL